MQEKIRHVYQRRTQHRPFWQNLPGKFLPFALWPTPTFLRPPAVHTQKNQVDLNAMHVTVFTYSWEQRMKPPEGQLKQEVRPMTQGLVAFATGGRRFRVASEWDVQPEAQIQSDCVVLNNSHWLSLKFSSKRATWSKLTSAKYLGQRSTSNLASWEASWDAPQSHSEQRYVSNHFWIVRQSSRLTVFKEKYFSLSLWCLSCPEAVLSSKTIWSRD